MPDDSTIPSVPLSLPKGGGAIRGIGETFRPNLFSGAGAFAVPIVISPGRNGFGPTLALQYSTGNGNGPFGLGWDLSLPRVTRKTEKGIPTYTDDDVFVISGAEDLVPHLEKQAGDLGNWTPVVRQIGSNTVHLYRPRTEGEFARIERWVAPDGDTHWRTTTPENVVSIFGRTAIARLTDPDDRSRVYEWLIEETFDARGNHIAYEYIQEDPARPRPGIAERNRSATQAYLRRILYGNTPDALDASRRAGPSRVGVDHSNPLALRERHYVFEVLFEYGAMSWPLAIPVSFGVEDLPIVPADWPVREDPFSTYRSGFEIRTLRRCQRVLMLHHFKEGELNGAPLIGATQLDYAIDAGTQLSTLASVTSSGYRRDPADPGRYLEQPLPPVTFRYSAFEPHKQRYQSVTADGGDLPPRALDAPELSLLDLFGDGIPDVVQSDAAGLHYWRNLGDGRVDRRRTQRSAGMPMSLADPNVATADLGGDGLPDVIVNAPPLSGFFESMPDGAWRPFVRFAVAPSFDLSDPNVRLIDLTGDGLSDVLMTGDEHLLWYRCRGESGYDAARRILRMHDLDRFPDVHFDDPSSRVRLADMSGDGLTDIVLVHDGRIDYWPNLGYGRFGRRVTMANTPRIGHGFDPRRLFLVDLDGSGCMDLVYVDVDRVHFWFNQSGNGWSDQHTLRGTPPAWDPAAVRFTDFYGTGTTALIWSYEQAVRPGATYKVLDFCGGRKPHLLVEMNNNMGATTRVQYESSTKFYLADKADGIPWATSLPFPVHVVEKTEIIDHVGRTKLTTTYRYHHGYYDGREREFRGFGRVDQFDTEAFADFSGNGLHGAGVAFDTGDPGSHVPPVETRSWFHTGVYFDADRGVDARDLTDRFRGEYYNGDSTALQIGRQVFQDADGREGTSGTPHQAFRALRGSLLRTEVFGRDGSARAHHPYVVTQSRFRVRALQPQSGRHNPVYVTTPLETVTRHYERRPDDPRVGSTLTLGVDDYGNVTDAVAISYPRRAVPADLPEQGAIGIIYTHSDFINRDRPTSAESAGFYYARMLCQKRSYEVTGIHWTPGPLLTAAAFDAILDSSIDVDPGSFLPYEQPVSAAAGVQRRLIDWSRTYFRSDAEPSEIDRVGTLVHRLPLGEIDTLGLPYESYQAALTGSLLGSIYGARADQVDLAREAGYHPHLNHPAAEGSGPLSGYWWVPSGRQGFDPDRFYEANRVQDPFGAISTTTSDVYGLLIDAFSDALPSPRTNVLTARNDYRVLQPYEITDPNGNVTQAAFDAIGLVVGTAVMGQDAAGRPAGDSLDGFVADLPHDVRDHCIEDPLALDSTPGLRSRDVLGLASTRIIYDLTRFARTGEPNVVYVLARETHVSDEHGVPSKLQHVFRYSDGFGREIQRKVPAEPGSTRSADAPSPRWVGSSWTVFNNKGKPVRQYEPFFTATHRFEFDARIGVSSILFYDPLARVVGTLQPNHTWEKSAFDAWRVEAWDVNDTALIGDPRTDPDVGGYFQLLPETAYLPTWTAQRQNGELGPHERAAARKAAVHADTPGVRHMDPLGRPVLTVAHNKVESTAAADPRTEEFYATRVEFDIEGNQRRILDANGREVMKYDYDMQGARVHQASMEAGERWMLHDVASQPIRSWDSRNQQVRSTYDELRRPASSWLLTTGEREREIGRLIYGETATNPEASNLRGRLMQMFDQAGVVSNDLFDFKGNLLRSRRQYARNYRTVLDWSHEVPLEPGSHASGSAHDALNRPVELTAADGSVVRTRYNEANLVDGIDVVLQGDSVAAAFVTDVEYDAKGQRTHIAYGNGIRTAYSYDKDTFRLTRLRTMRDNEALQDLHYTYDPVGNITHIDDLAQQTIFFNNQRVDGSSSYVYDAIYRLVEATGREHLGQRDGRRQPATPPDAFNGFHTRLNHPGDGAAMGTYIERYVYDAVGNILSMEHRGADPAHPGWRRTYRYDEASQLESGVTSNRLSSTTIGDVIESYRYDASSGLHGSMTSMPHLPLMEWDAHDQLRATSRQVVTDGTPEVTYYAYGPDGQRVRKITERQAPSSQTPTRRAERVYLGAFETYHEYAGDGESIALSRDTLHVLIGDQRVALVERRRLGQDGSPRQVIRYQCSNHVGSSALELDENASVISYEEYFPYGGTSFQSMVTKEAVQKRYRYTGKERDEESGLYYHGARYYAPWLARWTSPDPAGLTDGTVLYCYTAANPIGAVDPDGRDKVDVVESVAEIREFTVYKTDFIEVSYQYEIDGSIGSVRNFYLRNNAFGEEFHAVSQDAFDAARTVSRDLQDASPAARERLERASRAMGEVLIAGGVYVAACLALPAAAAAAGEVSVLGLIKAGALAETTADVAQAGVAAVDAAQNPTPQNLLALGLALGDVALGPTIGAEVATATRKDRRDNTLEDDAPGGPLFPGGFNDRQMNEIMEGARVVKPISGHTRHGVNQSISRNGGRGVSAAAIDEAQTNPDPNRSFLQLNGTMKLRGRRAGVILNEQGEVITVTGKARGPQQWFDPSARRGRPPHSGAAQRRANARGFSYLKNKIR